jgi:hypothetical protein
MELTLAEFSGFSLAAKSQILSYKGHMVAQLALRDCQLQLYSLGGSYIIKQVHASSGKIEKITPAVGADVLYLFAQDFDLSGLLAA